MATPERYSEHAEIAAPPKLVGHDGGGSLEEVIDEGVPEVHAILEAALAVEVIIGELETQVCPADGDDYDYNTYLGPRNGGELFGAAGIYNTQSLGIRNGEQLNTAEIEVFHVDDKNRETAYLGLLLDMIRWDSGLRSIYGPADDMATGEDMVKLAEKISPPLLALGWQIKYVLKRHHAAKLYAMDKIETFDPEDLRDLDHRVVVTHAFEKTSTLPHKELSFEQRINQLH